MSRTNGNRGYRCGPRLYSWDGVVILQHEVASCGHPCATYWADASLVLVFHHVVLFQRTGHGSSTFWTLFYMVGMFCSLVLSLFPLRAMPSDVTFENYSFSASLTIEMGKFFRAAMQCIWVLTFHGRYAMLPLFFLRSGRWQWGVLLGRSVAQRVREVGRSAVCKVRLIFGLYNRAHAFSDYNSGIIG